MRVLTVSFRFSCLDSARRLCYDSEEFLDALSALVFLLYLFFMCRQLSCSALMEACMQEMEGEDSKERRPDGVEEDSEER